MSTVLPRSPFDAALSIFNGLSIIQLKIGTTVPVTLVFEATKLEDNPTQEIKYLERPGLDGVVRKLRAVRTKGYEVYTFDLQEVKRLMTIFGGATIGSVNATCSLFVPDVNDDTGTVAMISEADFPCLVTRDGKVTHGDGKFSDATIKIESLKTGDIQWTKDAVVASS
jgi:hypothetical protein